MIGGQRHPGGLIGLVELASSHANLVAYAVLDCCSPHALLCGRQLESEDGDVDGTTCLHFAAKDGNIDVLRYLIKVSYCRMRLYLNLLVVCIACSLASNFLRKMDSVGVALNSVLLNPGVRHGRQRRQQGRCHGPQRCLQGTPQT